LAVNRRTIALALLRSANGALSHIFDLQGGWDGSGPLRTLKRLRVAAAPYLVARQGETKGKLVWEGTEYPRLDPGKHVVRGTKIQGPEWVRNFGRWSLRIEFATVHEPGCVSAFFNFGNDRENPHVGRQSKYFQAWVMANGELPKKGQAMSPDVFLDGQFFTVTVEDGKTNSDKSEKADAEVYSRITKFHSVEWPRSRNHSNQKSFNQESFNQESRNQPIK
jgi:hypothetical protein